MADPLIWSIEDGVVAFTLVDTAAVGYAPAWNAPAGKTTETAAMADYETGSDSWRCQVTSGVLTPSASTTTVDVQPTFCRAGASVPTPAQSTWTLDLEFLSDPQAGPTPIGLLEYAYLHDTQEVYFLLGLNGVTDPPRAIGRVRMSPGAFGGAARTPLTVTVSWPVTQWPDLAFGMSFV